MERLDITHNVTFEVSLKVTLECLERAIFLKEIGLLETAEFILFENIVIGGKY